MDMTVVWRLRFCVRISMLVAIVESSSIYPCLLIPLASGVRITAVRSIAKGLLPNFCFASCSVMNTAERL